MKRVMQFMAILTVTVMVAISCDSMTGSESEVNEQSTVLSKSFNQPGNASITESVSGDTFDPGEYSGWLFNRDASTQTPFIFTDDEASIGNGSLYVEPITNSINGDNDKFIGELFLDEEIANIDSLSYDFLIGNGGDISDANHFYLNIYANFGESDFDKFYDCRYDIVPESGSTSEWTTVTFDPSESYPVTTRGGDETASPYECPSIPADMDNLSPGSTIHFAAINLGDTSGNDQDLDGYFDNVVVAFAEDTTTYDFEPEIQDAVTKDDCKNGGWQELGFKNQGQCIRYVNTGKDNR